MCSIIIPEISHCHLRRMDFTLCLTPLLRCHQTLDFFPSHSPAYSPVPPSSFNSVIVIGAGSVLTRFKERKNCNIYYNCAVSVGSRGVHCSGTRI